MKRGLALCLLVLPARLLAAEEVAVTIIYRNFIQGVNARAIAVGYPGGVNAAFDADFCNVGLIWRGGFIDAKRHWTDRGGGFQPPLGYFSVHPIRSIDQRREVREGLLRGCVGFFTTAEFFVREAAGEGGAGPADAETLSFKCRGFAAKKC